MLILQISQGYMCLWCNDAGRTFYSMEAAQAHMIDKGHCKILHEGIALAEYADYYDYRYFFITNANNNVLSKLIMKNKIILVSL